MKNAHASPPRAVLWLLLPLLSSVTACTGNHGIAVTRRTSLSQTVTTVSQAAKARYAAMLERDWPHRGAEGFSGEGAGGL